LNGIQETRMAKTKSHVDRDQKREEILRAAQRLFLEDGYDATSMLRIAEEVRVAPNTLYWYFSDKDALLIAVLDVLVREGFAELERRKRSSLEAQLIWVLGVLSSSRGLITTVHSRVASVESLRIWHDGFHQLLEATIAEQLRSHGLAHGHEMHAARATMFVIEGLLAHPSSAAQQRALLRWLVSLVQRNAA
jgi:AcrR family transcriptional regulator